MRLKIGAVVLAALMLVGAAVAFAQAGDGADTGCRDFGGGCRAWRHSPNRTPTMVEHQGVPAVYTESSHNLGFSKIGTPGLIGVLRARLRPLMSTGLVGPADGNSLDGTWGMRMTAPGSIRGERRIGRRASPNWSIFGRPPSEDNGDAWTND